MECSRSSSTDCPWDLEGLHGTEDDLPGTMKDGFGPRQASCKGPPTLQAGGLPVGEQWGDGPEGAVHPGDSHHRGTGREPCRPKEPDPSAKPDLPWGGTDSTPFRQKEDTGAPREDTSPAWGAQGGASWEPLAKAVDTHGMSMTSQAWGQVFKGYRGPLCPPTHLLAPGLPSTTSTGTSSHRAVFAVCTPQPHTQENV